MLSPGWGLRFRSSAAWSGSRFRRIIAHGLDVVFPRVCVLCRQSVDDAHPHLCTRCRRSVEQCSAVPFCPRCGHSIGPFGVQDGKCYSCRDRRPRVRGMVRVGPYRDVMVPLVRAFKYHGRDELDAYLGGLLSEAIELASWRDEVEALVCVPTHWRHAINRGFYAPKALARVVSRRTGIPLLPLLRRVAAGPHQFDVPLRERAANIRGKFAVADGVEMHDATVCLIDDVSTTGATLNECARVLKRSGASTVYASVLARVDTQSHS